MSFSDRLKIIFAAGFALVFSGAPAIGIGIEGNGNAVAAAFIAEARMCIKRHIGDEAAEPLVLGILGLERTSTTLDNRARVQLRREIEKIFLSQEGVTLRPVADLGKVVKDLEATGAVDENSVRKVLRDIRDVDFAVYFEATRTSRDSLKIALVGISRKNQCLVRPAEAQLVVRLDDGIEFSDFKKLIESSIVGPIRFDSDVETVIVGKFTVASATPGRSLSLCADRIEDGTLDVLSRTLLQDPKTSITDRNIVVRRQDAEEKIADDPQTRILSGRFGRDDQGLWISAKLVNAANRGVTASIPRRHIAGLDCPAEALSLADYIVRSARTNSALLTVDAARPVFAIDQFIRFPITVWQRPVELYCWAIGDDETGFVLLPMPGKDEHRIVAADTATTFPGGFGLPENQASEPGSGVFGCFSAQKPLPPEIHAAWMAAQFMNRPEGADQIGKDEILRLLKQMRQNIGLVEAYSRYTIR